MLWCIITVQDPKWNIRKKPCALSALFLVVLPSEKSVSFAYFPKKVPKTCVPSIPCPVVSNFNLFASRTAFSCARYVCVCLKYTCVMHLLSQWFFMLLFYILHYFRKYRLKYMYTTCGYIKIYFSYLTFIVWLTYYIFML